jgi:hypothetical protein
MPACRQAGIVVPVVRAVFSMHGVTASLLHLAMRCLRRQDFVAHSTAFTTGRRGALRPIPGGTRDLPGADAAAQVSVTPDGRRLVVSERLSNRLETLPLDHFGRPAAPVIAASSARRRSDSRSAAAVM